MQAIPPSRPMTMRFQISRRTFTLLLSCGLPAGSLWALDPPQANPVLTVTGKLGVTNQGASAAWDLAMLEALPQTSFRTSTPWYNEPVTFSGPLLRDVLAALKANGTEIRATALNDYRITIPFSDTQRFDMIVATRMNGQHMPVRNKGPLFIVYPFDRQPELRRATYYERSIWQLKALAIE